MSFDKITKEKRQIERGMNFLKQFFGDEAQIL